MDSEISETEKTRSSVTHMCQGWLVTKAIFNGEKSSSQQMVLGQLVVPVHTETEGKRTETSHLAQK